MADACIAEKYIVGAYTTSPNLYTWDCDLESTYFRGLKKNELIRGLELPFWGEHLHPFDDEWLLSNLEPSWQNVLTCVPGTMKFLETDSYFGLASVKQDSRRKAINFYRRVFDCINTLKSNFGNKSVIAVFITSSPFINGEFSNADYESFALSLDELASWNWQSTRVVIEHCDALNKKNINPKKGFLSIEQEIETLKNINDKWSVDFGIVINWGRSAIEHRDIYGPIEHIKLVNAHNLLSGVMFSGTTDNNNNLYGAWSDMHMPPATFSSFEYFESESLMTFENIKNSLKICNLDKLDFLGIKLLALPAESSMEKRISINKDSLILLKRAINETKNCG